MWFNKFVAKHKVLALILINGTEFSLLAVICSLKVSNSPLRHKVSVAFVCAKAYLKLGEREKAREKLNYVLVYGNRLHIVGCAKQLLEEIE